MYQQVRRLGRRIAIAVAGGLVVLAGVVLAMPLVPGPGIALILLGLGILSLEFERPRLWLAALKAGGRNVARRLVRRPRLWLAALKVRVRTVAQRLVRRSSRPGED